MIKKYPWHFLYLIFVIFALINIFNKIEWTSSTDNILWEETKEGLVCLNSPASSPIKQGDLLLKVGKIPVKNKIDLARIITGKKYQRYEFVRDDLLSDKGVDISVTHTPASYYMIAFIGILFILITLNILNASIQPNSTISPPGIFFFLGLSLSGLLIFSPTGSYEDLDILFLILDRICYLLFPAMLLHYTLNFPIKSVFIKKSVSKKIIYLIYLIPGAHIIINTWFFVSVILPEEPVIPVIIVTLNFFRETSSHLFRLYLILSFAAIMHSSFRLVINKKQTRFIIPAAGAALSIISFIFLTLTPPALLNSMLHYLMIFSLAALPLSLAFFLSPKRVTDIESILKKSLSTSTILLFIFGVYFVVGFSSEQSWLLGIFWSLATLLTAGYLFRPIESTVQEYFEKIFSRSTYNFKRRLIDLINSLREERDLDSLSRNFLDSINHGFNLQKSSLIIYSRNSEFHLLPENRRINLSSEFIDGLMEAGSLTFTSHSVFEKKHPSDFRILSSLKYFQFLALKTRGNLTGVIAFGLKQDNRYLSLEDWELMYSIASSLSLSVENASLYSKLENQLNEINLLKEFNENIIENLNLGIVVLSKFNTIQTWNSFMEQKTGSLRKKALNKKAYTIFGEEIWRNILTHKKNSITLKSVTMPNAPEELSFDIYISSLKDHSNKVIGTILVIEDVTEKNMIQNQLVTSEKMASIGMLSAGIAHEINTPLTGISSYCQFILENPEDEDNFELIQKMQEQVIRANKITRTLLDFSRQKGTQPMELDIVQVIGQSISLVDHRLKKKNIAIDTDGLKIDNKIFGFPTRLQQLFINLIINACDAIEHTEGKISFAGNHTPEGILVSIKDNGTGISLENVDKIFDPFFTTKAPGKGTGLGLAITYNIVKEHYGEITISSEPGEGTTFNIILPFSSPLRRIKI